MKKLSALIIGKPQQHSQPSTGSPPNFHKNHLDALRTCPNFTWVGSSSSNLDRIYVDYDENSVHQGAVTPLGPALTELDLAVVLGKPNERSEIVQQLSGTRYIVITPPLGLSLVESNAFMALCEEKGVRVLISGAWRSMPSLQSLTTAAIEARIGKIFGGAGTYSGGLWHTGVLWIDLARHLIGDIEIVQALGDAKQEDTAVVHGDHYAPFSLTLASRDTRRQVMLTAIPQESGRGRAELILWGDQGCLNIVFDENEFRVSFSETNGSSGQPEIISTHTTLDAFYTGVANVIGGIASLPETSFCEGADMLFAERVVEAILDSAEQNGERFYFS